MPEQTFTALVTMTGNTADGDMHVTIAQIPAEPPVTEPPPDIEEPPPGSAWTPPSYLRTDSDRVAIPNVPRPAYLAPFTDPNFKTKITRVTGDPGTPIAGIQGARWGSDARNHYSSDQAWNADQTLIYLDTNSGTGAAGASEIILDGETYEPLFVPKNHPPSSDVRWHPTDPDVMLAASKSKLLRWNPRTGEQTTVATFSGFTDLTIGPWEGSPSRDGNRIVLTSDSRREAFVYDIAAAKKYPTIRGSQYGIYSDNCRISRDGTYMVWKVETDEVVITDFEGREIHRLPNNYVSHYDVAVDSNGDEVLCGRVNSSSVEQGQSGSVSKYRLKDGQRTGLQATKGWSSHTSCRSNTNYCVAGPTLEGGDYIYNGELIMCDMDGGTVWRLGHTHTIAEPEYVQHVMPSHSPDGGRVIFGSPWDSRTGVGCYVVDFRS